MGGIHEPDAAILILPHSGVRRITVHGGTSHGLEAFKVRGGGVATPEPLVL